MIRKYHNHKPQTTPWHREEEPLKHHETPGRQPHGTARKSHLTIMRYQEDKLSKATSSLFPIKMIAILKWALSNVQQDKEQLQTHIMGV